MTVNNLKLMGIDSEPVSARIGKMKWYALMLIAGVVLILVVGWFLWHQDALNSDIQISNTLQSKNTASSDTTSLVKEIGALIYLPEGEEPTIATVTDPDKLKDQTFFANAKKGDKVLIFNNAGKAILYDPIAHKILEVAPFSFKQ